MNIEELQRQEEELYREVNRTDALRDEAMRVWIVVKRELDARKLRESVKAELLAEAEIKDQPEGRP